MMCIYVRSKLNDFDLVDISHRILREFNYKLCCGVLTTFWISDWFIVNPSISLVDCHRKYLLIGQAVKSCQTISLHLFRLDVLVFYSLKWHEIIMQTITSENFVNKVFMVHSYTCSLIDVCTPLWFSSLWMSLDTEFLVKTSTVLVTKRLTTQ